MTVRMEPGLWPLRFLQKVGIEGEEPSDETGCPTLDALDKESRATVQQMAVELLWNWTGRKFSTYKHEVRPCRDTPTTRPATYYASPSGFIGGAPPQMGGWMPVLLDGEWYNVGCGSCPSPSRCNCGPNAASALLLPGPVHEVTSVYLGGTLLDEDDWKLSDGILWLLKGKTWPDSNDATGALLGPDSRAWGVVYQRGYPVPPGGEVAAAVLACELAKAMAGDSSCQLPSRVQSVTRQGVSMEIVQTEFSEMKDGRTGIWSIDSWLASVNADRKAAPIVYSPDVPGGQGRAVNMAQLSRFPGRSYR